MRTTLIFRRMIGGLLSVMMLLSMLPITALGAEIPQEWIVEFADNAAARDCANTEGGAYLGGPFALLRVSKARLERYSVVSLTENSNMQGSSASTPTDALASDQYILSHKSWYATDAWQTLESFLTGKSLTPAACGTVRVAVLDSGIDGTHEDLSSRVAAGWDAVAQTAIAAGADSDVSADSHGTKVAGLIGAASDNGLGIVGAAWTFPVELIPVRVLDSRNNGTIANIVSAIYWAVDEGEADILNLSFGKRMKSLPSAMQTAILHAVEQGVLVVAAAGNDGREYKTSSYSYYPAALEGVLPVGSTARALYNGSYVQRAEFSNRSYYDEGECGKTFFYTPGEALLTTTAGNEYGEFTGTSASAALFSGMLAALKSCADAAGVPGVEHYLSQNKYSYLGALYYQEYKAMAEALAYGDTSDSAYFTEDEHLPYEQRGTATISGMLHDPGQRYTQVRFYIGDVLAATAERTETARQHLSFTFDTTAFDNDYYSPSQLGLMGVLPDGTEEEISHTISLVISNDSTPYTVTVLSGGAPVVGAESCLFSDGYLGSVSTDNRGTLTYDAGDLEEGVSLLVLGEDLTVYSRLPAGSGCTFGANPARLTITCGEDALEVALGASVYVTMPDEELYEIGTITGTETVFEIDTDRAITFSVVGEGVILSQSLDLSAEDCTWDLDEAEAGAVTLLHDGEAPTEGTDGTVRFLGLQIGAFEEILMPAEGGSVVIAPGTYPVTGYIYWYDGDDYSRYAKVDFGTRTVTEDGLILTLGSGTPAAALTVTPAAPTEGQDVTFAVSFSDSRGNAIAELGSSDALCKERNRYSYANLKVEEYDAKSESWNDLTGAYLSKIPGKTTVPGAYLGDMPGQRRVIFPMGDYFSGSEAVTEAFSIAPQETRPAATVTISLEDPDGYTSGRLSAATVLQDGTGTDIVREAFLAGEAATVKLPVGARYGLAVLMVDYSVAYLTTCQVDLREAAAGDTVEVSLTADESWIAHQIPLSENGNGTFPVQNLAFAPFEDFPAYLLKGLGTSGNLETLYTSGFSETKLYFDVMLQAAEPECYEYPPVFTMEKTVDLSTAQTVNVSAPDTITLSVKTTGSAVTLTPVITDAYDNPMTGVEYVSRFGDMEGGMEGEMGGKPEVVYPVITVSDSRAQTVFTGSTAFAPVTVEDLEDGAYTAAIRWDSCDISMESGPVAFVLGEGSAAAQAAPTAFRAELSDAAVRLSWTAPEGGCAGYLLLRNGEPLAEPDADAVTYLDETVSGGTAYTYTLYAVDAEGAQSAPVTAQITTPAGADTAAPVWGEGAQLTAQAGESGILLSWSRAQDAGSGVTSYLVYCNGEELEQVSARSYAFAEVQPNTDYLFSVKAVDGAGNLSLPLTAGTISLPSGVLGVGLSYGGKEQGHITGKTITLQVKTTADLDSVSIAVEYTDTEGKSGTLTPAAAGSDGSFTATVTLPDAFAQVDQITVNDTYTCLDTPLVRRLSHVKITVDLAEAAALYPEAVLTLYAASVGYAYAYPVSGMAGIVEDDMIADAAYQLTMTDSRGNLLLSQTLDLSADCTLTLGAGSVRFLQLTVADGYAGLAVSVKSNGKTVNGTLDADGVAVWSNGGRFLPVGSSGTVSIPEIHYDEEVTFDKTVNEITLQPEELGYEQVTIPVIVLDRNREGVSGIEVRLAASDVVETKTTGADGRCVFTFMNRKNSVPMLSMQQQRDDQSRIWLYVSIPVYLLDGSTQELCPTQMFDTIVIRPVLNVDIPLEDISFSIEGQQMTLEDGLLKLVTPDRLWRLNQKFTVVASGTIDGKPWYGKANGWLDPDHPGQPVEIHMKSTVKVTLTLKSGNDVLKGKKRYFAVYDKQEDLITAVSTYDSSVTLSLAAGESYYLMGSWGQVPQLTDSAYASVREWVTVEEDLKLSMNLNWNSVENALFGKTFLHANGLSVFSAWADDDGMLHAKVYMRECNVENPAVSEVYNEVVLPAGVQDIHYTLGNTSFDPDTGILRFTRDMSKMDVMNTGTLTFSLPVDALTDTAEISHHTLYTYDGVTYQRQGIRFVLSDFLLSVKLTDRIARSALSADGITAKVDLACAQTGMLELYEGETLLAACATREGQRSYQLRLRPDATLGEHTVRAVYTGPNGLILTGQAAFEAVEDARPTLLSAKFSIGGNLVGDLMDNEGTRAYDPLYATQVVCLATFTHSDKVERVWLHGATESDFDRVELLWDDEQNGFYGVGQLGDPMQPFDALWIEFEETPLTAGETADEARGEVTVEYELTYTPEEGEENPYSYAPDPDLGEAVQEQALSDWEAYVQLVRNGLYDLEEEETIDALNDLFGEDAVWDLPAVTDGENHFSMRYSYDEETVAQKLSSDEAFTMMVNGEARKVFIELVEEEGDLYICIYGLGDLFIPAVAESDEPVMTAAGSLVGGLKHLVKRHWKDGMAIRKKYNQYKWIQKGLEEELNKDPENGDPSGDAGNPCSGDGVNGKQTRQQRREEVDKMFDDGWEASKAVAKGISMTGGPLGMKSTMFGSHLTKDGSVLHALFEQQKQRIHQIDDILDKEDEDAFADEQEDPCDKKEPGKASAGGAGRKQPQHPSGGYRRFWPLTDPSGLLYQGATGYPAAGVKAYLYYLASDGETWTLWNSEDFGQGPNPYPSEANGYYGWDVLPGRWKVVFEGEGYAPAESIVLDVPPPHLDVDISLTSTRNPQVLDAELRADGTVYLKFDHPMKIESVLDAVTLSVPGTLEAVDASQTTLGIKQAALATNPQAGVEVASIFRFLPEEPLAAGATVQVTVGRSAQSYSSYPMTADWSEQLTVPAQDAPMALAALERRSQEGIYLAVDETHTLGADDWCAVFTDGFGTRTETRDIAILWRSTDETVATVSGAGEITAVGGGIASIIGEYKGRTIAFGVSVTRAPILADAAENTVRFCRTENLVLGKACYMWSAAANFRLEDPMEGDEKYMPAAWRILEGGVTKASGTVAEGEAALQILYTPTTLGALTGEIDYQKYVCTEGRWVAVGDPVTASTELPVTEVTALALRAAPRVTAEGQLDLSAMEIAISLSDETVSTVAYGKLASYGVTMNFSHGDLLPPGENTLVLTHSRTGLSLEIALPAVSVPVSFSWTQEGCTVRRQSFAPGVIILAASYDEGQLAQVHYLTEAVPSVLLTGDRVKVFFLEEGSYAPLWAAAEPTRP